MSVLNFLMVFSAEQMETHHYRGVGNESNLLNLAHVAP